MLEREMLNVRFYNLSACVDQYRLFSFVSRVKFGMRLGWLLCPSY